MGLFTAERMDEEYLEPVPRCSWYAPPVLVENEYTKSCDFDALPDVVYWLSLQAFSKALVSLSFDYLYAYKQRAILPYLSVEVEFEASFWPSIPRLKAVNSMASVAAISQYNRYRLRKRRKREVEKGGVEWSTADDAAIRHYGMIIVGHNWAVYVTAP